MLGVGRSGRCRWLSRATPVSGDGVLRSVSCIRARSAPVGLCCCKSFIHSALLWWHLSSGAAGFTAFRESSGDLRHILPVLAKPFQGHTIKGSEILILAKVTVSDSLIGPLDRTPRSDPSIGPLDRTPRSGARSRPPRATPSAPLHAGTAPRPWSHATRPRPRGSRSARGAAEPLPGRQAPPRAPEPCRA